MFKSSNQQELDKVKNLRLLIKEDEIKTLKEVILGKTANFKKMFKMALN